MKLVKCSKGESCLRKLPRGWPELMLNELTPRLFRSWTAAEVNIVVMKAVRVDDCEFGLIGLLPVRTSLIATTVVPGGKVELVSDSL